MLDLMRSRRQLAETFAMTEATGYNWLKQDNVDRGDAKGQSTEQALELAAAKRRIRQLETQLAVSRKIRWRAESLRPMRRDVVDVRSRLGVRSTGTTHSSASPTQALIWARSPSPRRPMWP